jgi:tRNA pseudouridine55 synthase
MAPSSIPVSELPVFTKENEKPPPADRFQAGSIILMDKPINWTSFDVVKYVRYRIPVKKVGHAGTLDPLATGLLILCCGKATKSISQIQDKPKVYEAEVRFGASTPSYDAETDSDHLAEWDHITEESLEKTLKESFTGAVMQTPPIYSALNVGGERLYKKARRGEMVEVEKRRVEIYSVELLDISLPLVKLRIRCGKGTYIRSLAHDLGLSLRSRAYLASLRRTETEPFTVQNAFTPDEFNRWIKS